MPTEQFKTLAVLALVAVTSLTRLAAQQPTVDTATAGAHYQAGGFYRFWFGSSYRDVWTTPFAVEVLDLGTTGNGLTPNGVGGGQQSMNLYFIGADSLPYTFRSLDKDPTGVLPEDLKQTVAADVVQDQTSSAFPTAPPVVDVFVRAANIYPRDTRVVIMPDDARLGEYADRFAGRLGTLEVWANARPGGQPGFAGATEVISTDALWELYLADPNERVDLATFLKARLIDIYVGDWDRHRGQWRWGNVGPGNPPSWTPFPEDRDQAFARYDGYLFLVAGRLTPQLTRFGKKYPAMLGATWNGRDLDRWLLPMINKPAWDSIAQSVQAVLTDELIDTALSRLPESHHQLRGDFLRESLRERRDRFTKMSDQYYRHLSWQVDLQLTNVAEVVEAIGGKDGSLTIAVYAADDGIRQPAPYLVRRFDRTDTREVRLHLRGGNDSVTVVGDGGGIVLRVLSEEGHNTVVDTVPGKRTDVYDSRPDGVTTVGRIDLDDRVWHQPPTEPGELPPRDWGSDAFPLIWSQWTADLGLTVIGGYEIKKFGFRKQPFAQRHRVSAAFSFKKLQGSGSYSGTFVQEGNRNEYTIDALASGIEINNFYGFGNDTPSDPNAEFYQVEQNDFQLSLAYRPYLTDHVQATVGATGRYTNTSDDDTTFVVLANPYGVKDYGEVAGNLGLELDLRDRDAAPESGVWARVTGNYYPSVLSVADSGAFGAVQGFVAGYWTPLSGTTLALRAGGKKMWGTVPFQNAAFLGGLDNLRGYRDQRFAGDASMYFNSTLRIHLAEILALVPTNLGLIGLFDAGRVWYRGASDGDVHLGFGGGLSFAPLKNPRNALVLAAAGGDDGVLFFFQLGYAY